MARAITLLKFFMYRPMSDLLRASEATQEQEEDVPVTPEPAPEPTPRALRAVSSIYRWRAPARPGALIPANRRRGFATRYANTPINMRFNREIARIRESASAPAEEVINMLLHYLGEQIADSQALRNRVRRLEDAQERN